MKLSDVITIVRSVVEKEVHIPILIVGATGIGKTWIIKDIAKTLKIGYVDLRLAQMDIGDLIGIPVVQYKNAPNGNPFTYWAKPSWWPEEGSKGILVFEELNRAQQDVRQAIFQIINERVLHTHKLPEGWHIVAVLNPPDGSYQVEELDMAMMRRFCILNVSPSVSEWLEWAEKSGISSDIIDFIKKNPTLLDGNKNSMTLKNNVPTPDGYRMLSLLLNNSIISNETPFYIKREIITGIIGKEGAFAFLTFLKKNIKNNAEEFINGEDIVLNYNEKKEKIIMKLKSPIDFLDIIDQASFLLEQENLNNLKIRTNISHFLLDLSRYNFEIFIHFSNVLANNKNEEVQEMFFNLPSRKELTKLIKQKNVLLGQQHLDLIHKIEDS